MRRMGVLAVALAATLAAGCNNDTAPKDSPTVGTAGRADVRAADRDFVRDVATINMAEIELGRAAMERSASADVKKFADMMVKDHPGAGDKLKALATQYQIEVPAQLDDKHRDLREKMIAKQGLEFDKEYADAMVDGHQDFVDKLESRIDRDTLSKFKASYVGKETAKVEATAIAAEKSDNPVTSALNQWAAETYPVAYAHLEAAKALRDGVKKRSTD